MIPYSKQIKWFLESYYMIALTILVTVICYFCKLPYFPFYFLGIALVLHALTKASLNSMYALLFLTKASWYDAALVNRTSIAYYLTFSLYIIAIGIFVYDLIIDLKRGKRHFRFEPILVSMLCVLAWCFVSLVNTPSVKDSFMHIGLYVSNILVYVLCLLFFENNKENRNKFLTSVVLVGMVLGIQMVVKLLVLMQNDSYEHIVNSRILSVCHLHPNRLVDFFGFAIFVSFYYFIYENKIWKKILALVAAVILLGFTVITGSRSGIVIVLFGLFLYVIYYFIFVFAGKKKDKTNYVFAGIFIAGILAVTLLGFGTGLFQKAFARLKSVNILEDSRMLLYNCAWEQFLNHPIIGAGFGSSQYFIPIYAPYDPVVMYHNFILQTLGTIGIIGTIIFLVHLFFIGKKICKKNRLCFLVGLVYVVFILHGLVDNTFFNQNIEPVLYMFILIIPAGSMNPIIFESNPVEVTIDRKLGSTHPEHNDIVYPINYGYVDGIIGGDNEYQDCYVLGVEEPVDKFTGKVIAIIHRKNDNETKWVVAPEGKYYSKKQIKELTHFQEQFFDIKIEM